MSDSSNPSDVNNYLPSQEWSYGVPSPPHIRVPPPCINSLGLPDLHIEQDSINPELAGFENAGFLKTFKYDNLIRDNNYREWRYEQRRMAQEVLPFLWLGPVSAARDTGFLERQNITMVLAVRNIMSGDARLLRSKAAIELGIESQIIDVVGDQQLISAFPRGIETINAHLSHFYQKRQSEASSTSGPAPLAHGKVLVYCESGNERSAILVAAYLMAIYSMELIKAIQVIQAQRFCVAFDDASKFLLQSYGDILRAKRDSLQAGNGASPQAMTGKFGNHETAGQCQGAAVKPKQSKRNLDEIYNGDYEEDMEMDWEDKGANGNRLEARKGHAPFQS